MPPIDDLTPDEIGAIVGLLMATVRADQYPLSPRLRPLRSALAKLAPPPAPLAHHGVTRGKRTRP